MITHFLRNLRFPKPSLYECSLIILLIKILTLIMLVDLTIQFFTKILIITKQWILSSSFQRRLMDVGARQRHTFSYYSRYNHARNFLLLDIRKKC